MNAITPIRPNTRGFKFLDVGLPRTTLPLEDYTVCINGFAAFEINGFAVLQASLDSDGIEFFVELVELHSASGKPDKRTLSATDCDSADEARFWSIVRTAIESDPSVLETVKAEFTTQDYRHNGEVG